VGSVLPGRRTNGTLGVKDVGKVRVALHYG